MASMTVVRTVQPSRRLDCRYHWYTCMEYTGIADTPAHGTAPGRTERNHADGLFQQIAGLMLAIFPSAASDHMR